MDDISENEEGGAAGWDAIDAELRKVYGDQEPHHWGSIIKHRLGGPDPLDGVSAYARDGKTPHWHYVTYGFTELYEKESVGAEESGYGFELTFRLARAASETSPPMWPINFLNNLARYVFETGNELRAGEHMHLNGPIAIDEPTGITAMLVAPEPELSPTQSANGSMKFLQVVGITDDEYEAVLAWNSMSFLDLLRESDALLVTSLGRSSLLLDEPLRARIAESRARDGSKTGVLLHPGTTWERKKRLLGKPAMHITIGARYAKQLAKVLAARLPYGRQLIQIGEARRLLFLPAEAACIEEVDERMLKIGVPADRVAVLCDALSRDRGSYRIPWLANTTLEVG